MAYQLHSTRTLLPQLSSRIGCSHPLPARAAAQFTLVRRSCQRQTMAPRTTPPPCILRPRSPRKVGVRCTWQRSIASFCVQGKAETSLPTTAENNHFFLKPAPQNYYNISTNVNNIKKKCSFPFSFTFFSFLVYCFCDLFGCALSSFNSLCAHR